ncbi:acetyl-CoA synthetase-like protein [Trametes coccinea BRFM310]|uniref:Acetyl-CoA synthetase-like protein n=1 Tax=Trametes coccinea (strain BRFM310) TaxID=1353009 RepID=A0A1Y2IFG4_TRAC3|nr:acetyl-CoA synthetase-like protein [Trametes coccinea BRFM310]
MPIRPEQLPGPLTAVYHPPAELIKRDDVALPQLYEWTAKHNPNYPLFMYQDGEEMKYITYSVVDRAINRAAKFVQAQLAPRKKDARPVIGLFADAESISYICTALGIMRAGCVTLFVSTRNGSAAVADLLKRTGASAVVLSPDSMTRDTARKAMDTLTESNIATLEMPTFERLFPELVGARIEEDDQTFELQREFDMNSLAMIQHSSGSTGHPKPILWTHRRLFHRSFEPLQCETHADMTGSIIGCHGTPMYHGLGSDIFSAAPVCGLVLAVFKPASPPTIPSPDVVWNGIVATKADYTFGVPSFLDQWSHDPAKVEVMRNMRGLMFGGAPLKKEIGDTLASQGVALYNLYGCTEVGMMSLFAREHPGMDWQYFRLSPAHKCIFVPQEDDKYEIIVPTRADNPLPAPNTKHNGIDAYATNDLVIRHPTDKTLWRTYGRADEQIILSNGEKTNPVPLEIIINADPHIKASMIFGQGRFQNGVLVQPAESIVFDRADAKQLEQYRNMIWPTFERANQFAPQHSRIFKEMILVADPAKPFHYNVKGLLRRKFILEDYKEEIDALYNEVENSATSDVDSPTVWDAQTTLDFVRKVVHDTLGHAISDNEDIFRSGGDSLQATRIRNVIHRALRQSEQTKAAQLPPNIVFDAPSIAALSHAVIRTIKNAGADSRSPDDLWKFVEKYSVNFPARPAVLVDRPHGKDVVLITGTTGGFGCDALEHLLRDEKVKRVYAFNRKGSDALKRQRAQFRARGLDETLLDTPKFKMVEAVLHEPGFGVEPALLEEIQHSVSHILHNAWKVNFNLSLASFEVDIQGTRNLIDLALTSPYKAPPPVVFVSSVGLFANYKGVSPAPETPLDDPSSPFGSGYAEAKWISERVLQNVTEARQLRTVTVRLGQVCGDRVGHWNPKEWFPALVKTARFQYCLPDAEGNITWVPAYEAAKAYTEMRNSTEPILHLVHPKPVPWHTIVSAIAKQLEVPLVPLTDWIAKLEKSIGGDSNADVELLQRNPALSLLSFFKHMAPSRDQEPMVGVYLSTTKSTAASETLANLPELGHERVGRWLAAWKGIGFL